MRRTNLPEVVFCYVGYLLRCSGTLDGTMGKGEDNVSLVSLAQAVVHILHVLVGIYGTHIAVRVVQGLHKSGDLRGKS